MNLQESVFEEYKKHINAHLEENKRGALEMKKVLESSPLNRNGVLDKAAYIPKVYDEKTIDHFKTIAKTTHDIFGKVINAYRKSEDFRKLFPFSKELEELILLEAPYDGVLPIMRMDLFYHEDTGEFQFCEINTDGTAAMLRDLEIRKALVYNPAHQAVIRKYELEPFELFDAWVETFIKLYGTYHKKVEHPNIAIVDFLENATLADFEEFMRRFQGAGYNCEICDIRSLEYKDGALYSPAGNRIDAIYRRAVTADIMDHYEEVTDLLQAVREDAVFMAGAFATQIVHTKWLFYVLHHEMTGAFLSEEELAFVKAHVPFTTEFADGYISLKEVQEKKDDFILKPMDAYASKGTYAAGREFSEDEWKTLTEDLYGKSYIAQQYCKQYMTENIDFAWGDGAWHPYINMPGLYTYNGQFHGILMRTACEENIIYAHDNERTLPVFMVK
ncbi:MAG: hypothetical protein K5853_06005 [Lachnospiraceae bacterium]|nr:hypothetical protein [Lachnospiraceae bacterium]